MQHRKPMEANLDADTETGTKGDGYDVIVHHKKKSVKEEAKIVGKAVTHIAHDSIGDKRNVAYDVVKDCFIYVDQQTS